MKKALMLLAITGCAGFLHAQGPYYQQDTSSYQAQPQQIQKPPANNMQQGNGKNNSYSSYSQEQNNSSQPTSDQSLQSTIQNALQSAQSQNKYKEVSATVNSGNVVLSGSVDAQADKDALGGMIGGINGVRSVTNQVTVKGNGQQGSSQGYSNQPRSNGNAQGYNAPSGNGYQPQGYNPGNGSSSPSAKGYSTKSAH